MKELETAAVGTCPICGAHALSLSSAPLTVEFREQSYQVEGFQYEVCAECGETIHPAGQADEILKAAVSMARRARGLLTPDQIRQLRHDLGLTQVELEAVLGVGPKTVTRWEKGTVFQSAVADNFMRSIWAHPEVFSTANRGSRVCNDAMALGCYEPAPGLPTAGVVNNDFALAA